MKNMTKALAAATVLAAIVFGSTLVQRAHAQQLQGDALLGALLEGGYVLVMRHASAAVPERRGFGGFGGGRGPGGPGAAGGEPERELTEEGVGFVTGMRHAFRELDLPVGDVLTSPTLRTQQHARQLGHGQIRTIEELGTEAMESGSARGQWLAARAAESPAPGTNTVIITHAGNIRAAFEISDIAEGDTLILQPGNDGATIVARVPIAEWARLSVR